ARLHAAERTRSSGALTRTGHVLGTVDYMAPEQALDPRQVDIRSDLYSLGCTFYFLLTGQPPFGRAGTLVQRMNRHLTEEAPRLTALRPDLPPELGGIVVRLMAKDPAQRFATPAELARHLAPLLGQSPVVGALMPRGGNARPTLSNGFSAAEPSRRLGILLLL